MSDGEVLTMPNTREKLIELIAESRVTNTDDRVCINGSEYIADHLIANGVTVQKWIPVKERLPEYGQQVIVYTGNILSPMVMAYMFWDKDYDSFAHITHWMPLPEPPKGE